VTIQPWRDRWRNPKTADLIVLRAYAETGTVDGAARELGLTVAAARKRLHRLYRERGFASAVQAVWALRAELAELN
jgi:predicted ArsR family transcriptional regulator